MGVMVTWDNVEQTIFRFDFLDAWTWEEFGKVFSQSKSELHEADKRINLILYYPEEIRTSSYAGTLRNLLLLYRNLPKSACKTVIVTNSLYYSMVLNMLKRISPNTASCFQLIESLDHARDYIKDLSESDCCSHEYLKN